MCYNTEKALASAPGFIFGELDCGGMIVDRNSGEFIPADQVLRDPLHINQLDIISQDHLGGLKLGAFCEEELQMMFEESYFQLEEVQQQAGGGDDEIGDRNEYPVVERLNEKAELLALIASQEVDEATCYTTCTKGRHSDQCRNKPESNGPSHGLHGRQEYKDRRLRAKGSGKTKPRTTVW